MTVYSNSNVSGVPVSGIALLAQSAVPVMLAQSGYIQAGGVMLPGTVQTSTVTLSGTSGSVTVTLSAAMLSGTSTDNGKQITFYDATAASWRSALITAFSSTTACTATLSSTASGTSIISNPVSFGNPLPTNYSGVWAYLPAASVSGGSAGFYWATATSTATANGVLQVTTTYQATMGTPSIPSGTLVNAVGSGSNFTQTTSAVTLASVTIPGGAMGANGAIRDTNRWQMSSNSNGKATRSGFGGVQISNNTNTSDVGAMYQFITQNRGVQNSQIAGWNGYGLSYGQATFAIPNYLQVDSTQPQPYTFIGQLTNATDFLVLESLTVEVLPA